MAKKSPIKRILKALSLLKEVRGSIKPQHAHYLKISNAIDELEDAVTTLDPSQALISALELIAALPMRKK